MGNTSFLSFLLCRLWLQMGLISMRKIIEVKKFMQSFNNNDNNNYSTTMSWIRTSLIRHSENIPLRIAFIEESKSEPKRNGF